MHWSRNYIVPNAHNKLGFNWMIRTPNISIAATIRKSYTFIWKVMDEDGLWSEDQNTILQILSIGFCRRFKKDPNVVPSHAMYLSRDITSLDNQELTHRAIEKEVALVVHQISPLKLWVPMLCMLYFIKITGIY